MIRAIARRQSLVHTMTPLTMLLIFLSFLTFSLAEAQQPKKLAKIGYLIPSTPAAAVHPVEAFRQGLRELGHVEGKTFLLELRYGQAKAERFPELARELVGLKVDVIVTASDGAIVAVKRETQTIPIVMAVSSDPVGTGFVASLAHPGGNLTGLSMISPELSRKRLELLREVVPGLSRVVFSGIPMFGAVCLTTTRRRLRPVRYVCSFNPLKCPAPRSSIALCQ